MDSLEQPPSLRAIADRAGSGTPVRRNGLLHLLGRELCIGIPLACAIAGFLSLMMYQPFLVTLIYSLCIGMSIQALIALGRYGMSYQLRQRLSGHRGAFHDWPGWPLMGPWVVASAAIGYYAGHWLADFLTGSGHAAPGTSHDSRGLSVTLIITFMISIGCTYFFYSRGRIAVMQTQAESALRAAAENQLRLLESQLEPHMLFNTLANLRVLIRLDPPRAEAMLDRLIAFLRATLVASQAGSHSLTTEFARIDDYLELMQVRMGPRLRSRLDLPPDLANLPVPPLLLQPLVENAIKHGLEPQVEGGRIDVTARRHGNVLLLTVRDTGVGLALSTAAADGTHFGMRQVRERLAALYGSDAALALAPAGDADGGTVATVQLPVADAAKMEVTERATT